jgi:hypothetical protein
MSPLRDNQLIWVLIALAVVAVVVLIYVLV